MAGEFVEQAKLAEQAERYEDLKEIMKEAAQTYRSLDAEQRNLLSIAYKNVITAQRTAWRIIAKIEQRSPEGMKKNLAGEYRVQIENELRGVCNEVLELLGECLLPAVDESGTESRVFYLKMRGDYYRYLAEITPEGDRDDIVGLSKSAYSEANHCAQSLSAVHPIRLGLALNFSVFFYEIAGSQAEACHLASQAYDAAAAEADQIHEYKESPLILQLLKDNLMLWTSDYDEME